MPTLYVENISSDIYEALRERARKRRTSISAEVSAILEANVRTLEQQRAVDRFIESLRALQKSVKPGRGKYQTAEEMIREDRDR